MKASEKAIATRKANETAREEKKRKAELLRERLIDGCFSIVEDPLISTEERLEALKIVNGLIEGM